MATAKERTFRNLKGNACFWIVPPNVTGMMCGVKYARQDKTGAITLTYRDDSEERTPENRNAKAIQDFDSIFEITSFVQSFRS